MLFRAVFWIGLVALLMPHESGTPATHFSASQSDTPATDVSGDFRDALLDRLADLKVEIEAAEQARYAHGG